MQNTSNTKSKLIFGTLAVGGLAIMSKILYDYLTRIHLRAGSIRPIYLDGVRVISRADLIKLLKAIYNKTTEEVTKSILHYRSVRRNVMDDIEKYENAIAKMETKLGKIINEATLFLLQSYGLSQSIFERSIEYHNDREIQQLIGQLTAIVKSKESSKINRKKLLDLLEFYEKIQKSILESTDIQAFDSGILSYQIEDKIWQEFDIEMNDIDWNSDRLAKESDLMAKLYEISEYMTSIQKLNKSLFK